MCLKYVIECVGVGRIEQEAVGGNCETFEADGKVLGGGIMRLKRGINEILERD